MLVTLESQYLFEFRPIPALYSEIPDFYAKVPAIYATTPDFYANISGMLQY